MAQSNALSKDLLRGVSRSFYLSMKVLPLEMREPVSLAYLLARATDTIADTADASDELRLQLLQAIRKRIFEKGKEKKSFYDSLKTDFIAQQSHPGEKLLLQRLGECYQWLDGMERADQFFITTVLGHITNGQIWDLERFAATPQVALSFVENADELKQYTYWVAGSVGEFWTDVGFANGGRHFSDEESVKMKQLGREFGQGLQLVNVLRDFGEDLDHGRCYLPKDQLIAAGWDGTGKPSQKAVTEVRAQWLQQCRAWLQSGRDYAKRVKSRRVRYATILPCLIAEKTLDALERAGESALQQKVKIPRWQVRMLMVKALFS
ncbi:MAG: squalene/phytoene synthase family protein [Verrucomicrobiales bacterium]|nr:squalene/phytoene synthase family protein [Verrucomicrobiales bacterium]